MNVALWLKGKAIHTSSIQRDCNANNSKAQARNTSVILSATVISHSVLTSGIYSTSLMVNSSLEIEDNINIVMIDDEWRLHQNISD